MPQIPVISAQEFAAARSALKTALQLVTPLVQYDASTAAMQHAGFNNSPAKVAAAAASVEQLASLLEGLCAKHTDTVKAAQALVDAVKLAQDGLIDVGDILDHVAQTSEVKVAEIGRLVSERTEEAEPAQSGHQARGTDALTSFLRRPT